MNELDLFKCPGCKVKWTIKNLSEFYVTDDRDHCAICNISYERGYDQQHEITKYLNDYTLYWSGFTDNEIINFCAIEHEGKVIYAYTEIPFDISLFRLKNLLPFL